MNNFSNHIEGDSTEEFIRSVSCEGAQHSDLIENVIGVKNERANYFDCEVIQQKELAGHIFWVVDYIDNVPTKYTKEKNSGEGRMIVLISSVRKPTERNHYRKFFTGSTLIRTTMEELKSLGKLPILARMYNEKGKFSLGPVEMGSDKSCLVETSV